MGTSRVEGLTAAVLGIGNVVGALGGTLLDCWFVVQRSCGLVSRRQPAKDAIAFTVLVLILIFRPQGLMGERISKSKM
jgi:branched-chain amino acid transport system permease protein